MRIRIKSSIALISYRDKEVRSTDPLNTWNTNLCVAMYLALCGDQMSSRNGQKDHLHFGDDILLASSRKMEFILYKKMQLLFEKDQHDFSVPDVNLRVKHSILLFSYKNTEIPTKMCVWPEFSLFVGTKHLQHDGKQEHFHVVGPFDQSPYRRLHYQYDFILPEG